MRACSLEDFNAPAKSTSEPSVARGKEIPARAAAGRVAASGTTYADAACKQHSRIFISMWSAPSGASVCGKFEIVVVVKFHTHEVFT